MIDSLLCIFGDFKSRVLSKEIKIFGDGSDFNYPLSRLLA